MYKVHLDYTDFNDEKVSEDLYFNFTKAELLELNLQKPGGISNYARSIINARDTKTLAELFKELLLKSYGEKSPDGKHFMKNDEIREKFECSIPFDILYVRYSTNDVEAAAFFNGIIPKDLREEVEKMQNDGTAPQLVSK